MMRSSWCIAWLVAFGCGPSSYTDFRVQLDNRWCARQIRCGQVGASEPQKCGVPDVLALTEAGSVDVTTAAANHKMLFHSDNASECLGAVKNAPCDPIQAAADLYRHCHGVVTANVPAGGDCLGDEECAGGVCVGADCGGHCVPYAAPGSACMPSGAPPAMACDPTFAWCDGSVCQVHKQPGDACAQDRECAFDYVCVVGKCDDPVRLSEGDACNAGAQPPCKDGLRCDETGTCVKPGVAGAACTRPTACSDGLACIAGQCAPWLDAGGACTMASATSASGCPATQACAGTSCVAMAKKGAPNAACTVDDDCADRLWCNSGFCSHRSGVGAGCMSDHECISPLVCDSTTMRCRKPVSCPTSARSS
jgi:hypothetical protein